jgi:hypothetical protein
MGQEIQDKFKHEMIPRKEKGLYVSCPGPASEASLKIRPFSQYAVALAADQLTSNNQASSMEFAWLPKPFCVWKMLAAS